MHKLALPLAALGLAVACTGSGPPEVTGTCSQLQDDFGHTFWSAAMGGPADYDGFFLGSTRPDCPAAVDVTFTTDGATFPVSALDVGLELWCGNLGPVDITDELLLNATPGRDDQIHGFASWDDFTGCQLDSAADFDLPFWPASWQVTVWRDASMYYEDVVIEGTWTYVPFDSWDD